MRRRPSLIISAMFCGAVLLGGACDSNNASDEAETTFRDVSEHLVTLNDDIQEAASGTGDADVARRTLNRYVPTIASLAQELDELAPKITGKRHDAAAQQATAAVALASAYSRFQAGLQSENAREMSLASEAIGEAADEIAAATEAWNAAGTG